MWIIAVSGWVVAVVILGWTKYSSRPASNTDAQLQQTTREFTAARQNWRTEKTNIEERHRTQVDAIHASAAMFEVANTDPATIEQFVTDILNKTKTRSEPR